MKDKMILCDLDVAEWYPVPTPYPRPFYKKEQPHPDYSAEIPMELLQKYADTLDAFECVCEELLIFYGQTTTGIDDAGARGEIRKVECYPVWFLSIESTSSPVWSDWGRGYNWSPAEFSKLQSKLDAEEIWKLFGALPNEAEACVCCL